MAKIIIIVGFVMGGIGSIIFNISFLLGTIFIIVGMLAAIFSFLQYESRLKMYDDYVEICAVLLSQGGGNIFKEFYKKELLRKGFIPLKYIKKALEIEPNDVESMKYLTMWAALRISSLKWILEIKPNQREISYIQSLIEKGIKLSPSSHEFYDAKGILLDAEEKHEQARTMFLKSGKLRDDPYWRLLLATSWTMSGDHDNGLDQLVIAEKEGAKGRLFDFYYGRALYSVGLDEMALSFLKKSYLARGNKLDVLLILEHCCWSLRKFYSSSRYSIIASIHFFTLGAYKRGFKYLIGGIKVFFLALACTVSKYVWQLSRKIPTIKLLHRIIEFQVEPESAEAWNSKGIVLGKLGKYDDALKAFDRAIELKPDDTQAWYNEGIVLGKLGRNDDALNVYDRAIELKPDDMEARHNRGIILGKLGRNDDALKAWDRVIELKPDYAEAWYNKGAALANLGKNDDALKAFDRAIDLKPDHADAWYNEGIVLGKLGKYDDALKAFDRAIDLKPDHADAWYNKGSILGGRGRHDDALKAFDRAIELKPDDTQAWYNKGIALGKLGRHDDALKAFDRAIELKPDYAEAWYNKGIVLGKIGKDDGALKAWDRAIDLKPDYADAIYNKACSFALMGKKEEALSNLEKVINLAPHYKKISATDGDFRSLSNDEEFKTITQ